MLQHSRWYSHCHPADQHEWIRSWLNHLILMSVAKQAFPPHAIHAITLCRFPVDLRSIRAAITRRFHFASAIGPRAATFYHMKHSFNSNCAYFRQRRLETAPTPKIGTSAQMLPHQTGLENHSSRPVSAVPRIEIQQRYPVTMSLESPDTTSSLDYPEDVNEFTGKSAR